MQKSQRSFQLLEQLRVQVHSRKSKKVEILALSQEVSLSPLPPLSLISPSVQICRTVDGGRVTSCKSAKDRTAMAVTLEQTHILLKEMKMAPSEQQHCLDTMRRSAIYHLTVGGSCES